MYQIIRKFAGRKTTWQETNYKGVDKDELIRLYQQDWSTYSVEPYCVDDLYEVRETSMGRLSHHIQIVENYSAPKMQVDLARFY